LDPHALPADMSSAELIRPAPASELPCRHRPGQVSRR
jgi:hypothetical protein